MGYQWPVRVAIVIAVTTVLTACGEEDNTLPGDGTFTVDVTMSNVNHNNCTISGCTQLPIQLLIDRKEEPPCCVVAPQGTRTTTLVTFTDDEVTLKACRIDDSGCDSTRCRVTAVQNPTGQRPNLKVRFDNESATGTIGCSEGWTNI